MRNLCGLGWVALALLLALVPAGRSAAAAPAEHATPTAAPIVDLPRLTLAAPASPPLEPGILWEHPPEPAPPLSPVTAPGAAEPSPSPSPAPAMPPPASAPYAKAAAEDRGCALPDALTAARRPGLAAGSLARLRAAGNLRVAPACDAKVLDVLEAGDRVTVLEAAGTWYRVGRDGRALGYVGSALLAPVGR
ncbi:SH3 domain-containing protein [Azospirillum picis]|uniref:SH3 domain-containing protein n=1 Tax=Azospirillum picis TaxID=488438 RepID=UPI00361E3CB2